MFKHILHVLRYLCMINKPTTMKKLNVFLMAMLATSAAFAQTSWKVDKAHAKVGFNATHLVVTEVEGQFKDFDITVSSKTDDFNGADVTFDAKTASISTDNEKRDGHLKSDDFLNAEKYPDLKFAGQIVKTGDKYVLKGNLTIRDVTKPVTFEVTYGGQVNAFGGTRAGFKVKGKIDRFDYNLKWDKAIESGGLIVGKEVELFAKIELVKG
jgi:polyisoprenoid-binding protein YceI